jgi:Prophage tail length tape measure protein.
MAEIANLNTKLSLESASFVSGVEKSRGALRNLIASLDPVAAATARYNRNVQLLESGLKRGTLSAEQHGVALSRLNMRYQEQIRGQTALATSTGSARAGMQQLSYQLGDVATQFASGTRPMMIFAQQGGQVIQAIQLMTNGTKGLLGFLAGPWGIALTAATVALSPFIAQLFKTEDALDRVGDAAEQAMQKLRDSLASVSDFQAAIDANQTKLLTGLGNLARANRELAQTQRLMNEMARTPGGVQALEGLAARVGRLQADKEAAEAQVREAQAGLAEVRSLRGAQRVAGENQEALNARPDKPDRGQRGPSVADIERRFQGQLASITQQILGSRQQLATTAEERAELEARAVEWARREAIEDVKADEHFTAAQKAELEAALTRRADAELEAIALRKRREQTRMLQALTDERYRADQDALQVQLELADTEADRKAIALRIFDAEEAYLEAKLRAVVAADSTADEEERRRAQIALDAMLMGAGDRRTAVSRANETEVERYLRNLNRTPAQINEALDHIKIDGLDALNDGLVDAITGVKSLGDAFSDIADQIIADLVRIAVQKYITSQLASALFGGAGGGPANLLGGTPFGGGIGGLAGSAGAMGPIGGIFTIGKVLGLANGGTVQVGGAPGIDRNVMSINGTPAAMVSAGEYIHVSPHPPGQDRAGGVTVNVYAQDAVLTHTVRQWVAEGVAVAIEGGGRAGMARMAQQSARTLR